MGETNDDEQHFNEDDETLESIKDSAGFRDFWRFINDFYAKKETFPKDITVDHKVPLFDWLQRKDVTIEYKKQVVCRKCQGKKNEPGTTVNKCSFCQGKGSYSIPTNGKMRRIQCSECKGEGHIISTLCYSCNGSGSEKIDCKHVVSLKSATENIRVKGKGNEYSNIKGDLFVNISCISEGGFAKRGIDIESEIFVTVPEIVLEKEVTIRTLLGDEVLKLKRNMKDGEEVRLKGKGTSVGKEKGDHVVKIRVKVPYDVSGEEKEIYQQLREIEKLKV